MPVRVQCPNEQCRASYSVSDADLGRSGKCKKCGTKFELYPTLDPADGPPNSWASSGSGSGGGADAALPSELEVGSLFGRYRVERPLGRGGMGAVYLAHDSQLDRPVALKVPHFTAGDGPEVIERFYREAKAAAGFDHPNLCPVYDVGQVNGTYYLTMPYIEGRPLSALVSDGPIDPRRATELVQKLAMALAEAHNRGVIHRDLKPSNVMVHPRRGVVVMDFGLARRAFTEDMRLTKTGSILGTPAYMSPEQVNGDVHAMGPGCDIYSLGVILYELLTGRLPFEGSMAAVLGQIMVKDPSPPTALRPGLDRRLEAICLKAMNKKPADRFGSMEAMAASLGAVLRSPAPTVVERPAPPKPKIPGSSVEVDVIDAEVIEEAPPPPPPPRPRTPTPKPKPAARPEPHPLDSGPSPYRPRPSAVRPRPQPQPDQPPPRRPPIGLIAGLAGGAAALLVMLGVVIYVATDNGTVMITVADAAKTAIHIDGEEITVEVPETRVKLRTGNHRLLVTYGNTVVEAPKSFTIKRGDVTLLTIEYPVAGPGGIVDGTDGVAASGVNSVGLAMVPIAAGEFTMGSPDSDSDGGPDERPAHRVRISNGFALGRTEVTQAQFQRVMGSNPSTTIGDDLPVHNVTWVEAVEFCNKLSAAEGLPPYYDLTTSPVAVRGGAGYRLPTEAEWEYACRAGTTTRFSFGDDVGSLGNYAWFDGNSEGQPHPVGQKLPNAFGLHDMHGNVWEWCWDWYDGSTYSNTGDLDPTGPHQTSGSRVIRGGSHSYSGAFHRSAYRNLDLPEQRFAIDGFRVARSSDGRGPVPPAGGVGAIPAPFGNPGLAATPVNIRLASVPAGTFWMGSTDDDTMADRDEKPRRRVTITRPFAIGVYEVTRAEYRRVVGRDPSQLPGGDTHPVDSVSWIDALTFCNALSIAEGLPPYYAINGDSSTINGGGGYRLPTEAEWEYACRAGTDTRYSYGDDASQLGDYGWFSDNSGSTTHPVGEKRPNPWGLYDVHGNANEWVWDRHGDPAGPADLVDPLGPPEGSMHVVRGGYYDNSFAALRSAYRYLEEPAKLLPRYGLRVVRTLDGVGAVAPPAAAPVAAAPAGGTTNSLGMALAKIPNGTFTMGAVDADPDGGDDEKPRRSVIFSAPYYLGTTEVTQAQFRRIMGSNPSTTQGDDLPVHGLTWFEAIDFCNKLSASEGLPPYYTVLGGRATINGGNGYRLPTEAEWEHACRAGSDGRFSYGDDASQLGQHAWYSENSPGVPQRVAQKQPNAYGLYDMHGNVWEWCWDWYDGSYYGRAPAIDPTGPEEERGSRVIRGGSYQSAPSSARSSYRNLDVPDGRFIINGFRVARTAS